MNHTVDTCFLWHGYPPGYKQKGKGQNYAQNSSQSQDTNSSNKASSPAEDSLVSSFGFTQEEFQSIRALLQ